ncbi:hypothetical protein GCM10009599_26170 [Luteococcus peritonei]
MAVVGQYPLDDHSSATEPLDSPDQGPGVVVFVAADGFGGGAIEMRQPVEVA